MHNRNLKVKPMLLGVAAILSLTSGVREAAAQEILLTGPLAGAQAVRNLKLYREGRFEIAPQASFTLLDEYQRTIFLGAKLNYNMTDWLALGVWGATGSVVATPTDLSEQIQSVNAERQQLPPDTLERRLVAVNLGEDFRDQLATVEWVAAPQLTFVPFRGKIALFQSVVLDSDLFVFGGAAFANVKERAECLENCSLNFEMASRMAIAPTFGLGLSFFVNDWSALGFEWRAMPFAWNTAGFDVGGTGPRNETPDNLITSADRQFKMNSMLSVSYNIFLPAKPRISE